MRTIVSPLLCAASLLATSIASADVPNDNCGSRSEGDACETYDGTTGTCEDRDGELVCVAGSGESDGCSASPVRSSELPGMAVVALGLGILVGVRRRGQAKG